MPDTGTPPLRAVSHDTSLHARVVCGPAVGAICQRAAQLPAPAAAGGDDGSDAPKWAVEWVWAAGSAFFGIGSGFWCGKVVFWGEKMDF